MKSRVDTFRRMLVVLVATCIPMTIELQGPYGGPLPEYWISREDSGLKPGELNTAQPTDETGSHGWGAVPLLWLHDTLLGVRIAEPGGGALTIAPQSAGLPYVAGQPIHLAGPCGCTGAGKYSVLKFPFQTE